MSNMYSICKNKGFNNLKIHHVGGLWIWILFPSTNARNAFQDNETLKNLAQTFKIVSPSFKFDEHLVWIEINGLPLCAWGSTAFKKVASVFGKFLFFENEQSTSICTGKVCIATKCQQIVSEKVQVEINNENFVAHVQEIGTWSINIINDSIVSQSSDDESEEARNDISDDVNSEDESDDIINDLHKNTETKEDIQDNTKIPSKEKDNNQTLENNMATQQASNECNSNDLSYPPGFSLINEMTRIIEVGDSLGYDVRGCRKSLKKMIDGIGVQKSKMTKLEIFRLKSMWGNYSFDYACSMARGRSGGIISMWDPNIFVKKDIWCDDSFVIVKGQWKNLDGDYFMINLYGPQDPSDKDVLWRRIKNFMHQNNGAFVLFGDFNEVCFNFERLGSTFSQSQANTFNTFITNNDLIELPMGNRSFIWMIKSGSKVSKLDRFLLSANAIEALPNAYVTALDKLWSNHNPILLHCKKVDYGPTPFSHKEATLIALKNLEVKIDTNSATDEDRESRIKLFHEIDKLDRLESLDLQQKSRINLDIEGDENSKFFHGIINQRRQTNTIQGIMCDGSWTTDPNLVKDTFLNFFKENFKLHDLSHTFPSTSFPSNLTVYDHTLLDKDVNMEEIKIIGSSGITLSHMFYADDVVITANWNPIDMENIFRILQVFYLALRLKINIHKSNVYGVGVTDNEVNLMASSIGLPEVVLKMLEKKRATFFWGGTHDIRKLAWVKWPNVLASHDKGGLRIGSLKSFNLALLQKWRWRMIYNTNVLWVKVIKALHCQEGGFGLNAISSNGLWSKIVGSSNFLHSNSILRSDSIRFRVGCGSSTRFWKDLWTDRLPHRLNISSRGIDIPSIGYLVCDANVESSNHIFFECDNAKVSWNLVYTWCNVPFPTCASFDQWKVCGELDGTPTLPDGRDTTKTVETN
ncbi:RNA-directed DNA polymerase, eukaryota, reverse transcriptase zinc-binding domain protein [Tanacetum coccineum]